MSPALEYDYLFCFVALLSSGLRGFKCHRSYVIIIIIIIIISKDQLAEVAGLQSNLEEVDTRIIVHADHAAADGYRAFVVTCDGMGTRLEGPITFQRLIICASSSF